MSQSLHALCLTHIGLEQISAQEIAQLISAKNITTSPGKIFFWAEKLQDLATLAYACRTITKVLVVLATGTFSGIPAPSILPNVKKYLDNTACIACERSGDHQFTSYDLEKEFNTHLARTYSIKIDYKKPQTHFLLIIEHDTYFFCLDLCGIDLGRRSYRIFLGTEALKGTLSAGALFFAGYDPKNSLADPFCRHGVIPIEAALFSTNTSPNKFDKEKIAFSYLPHHTLQVSDSEKKFSGTIIAMDPNFKHISAARKNAKIAGIVKEIDFSRTDLEFLDAKFGKATLDCIITYPPQSGRSLPEKIVEKIYHQLFYHAAFVLKKTGSITLCVKRTKELALAKATEFGLKLTKELLVKQGEEDVTFLHFSFLVKNV